jgi:hypothetical protein
VLPDEWKKGMLIKLPKKRNLTNCNNWRGITLLSLPSKILTRIKGYTDNKLRRKQMGFHTGRSCTDQVNTLRIILEHQPPLYLIFIDFEKAFGSINRNKMQNAMRIFGLLGKVSVEFVKCLCNKCFQDG